METIIPPLIAGLFTLLVAILTERWRNRQLKTSGYLPKVDNQAAYEMAYRGTLHNLAGRRRECRVQTKTGKAWLREAAYLHRPSSRAGQNDAIDDIKSAVTASTMIAQDIHCDQHFLENEIRAKLQLRIGNRPAAQILQIRRDAIHAAELYQQIIQSQMRILSMIDRMQFIFGIALFGIGAFLLAMIPSAWSALSGLPPGALNVEWMFQFWVIYTVVSLGCMGGGIALLLGR